MLNDRLTDALFCYVPLEGVDTDVRIILKCILKIGLEGVYWTPVT
jgi:hypothetical protein